MRRFLILLVVLESAALAAGAGLHLFGGLERFQRAAPAAPVFRPPIHDAVIGDLVTYERRHPVTEEVLGYLEYEIRYAVVTEGTTLGPEFIVRITERDAGGEERMRDVRLRPRAVAHGFLPIPFAEEDDYPTGARPVVKTIRTARFPFRRRHLDGFLVEAVVPRDSLTEPRIRYWMSPGVPVFGVARWETPDEVLVVHRMDWGREP